MNRVRLQRGDQRQVELLARVEKLLRRSRQVDCRFCAVYRCELSDGVTDSSSPVLVVLRVQPGGVSCHHPNRLFTRVSSAPP